MTWRHGGAGWRRTWRPRRKSRLSASARRAATYFSRAHGRLEYGLVAGDRPDQASEFVAAPSGEIDRDRPIRVYRYDPRVRPWYATAVDANEPLWTPVYFWFGDK